MIASAVVGGLLLLGILIFSIPLNLTWVLEIYGRPKVRWRLEWFFGLISREITGRKRPQVKKRQKKTKKRSIPERIRILAEISRIKGLGQQILRWLKGILKAVKIRKLEAEFTIGLDDPADTVSLFMLTGPLNRILEMTQLYPVSIQPSFVKPGCEGFCEGQLRIYPVLLVPPTLRFIFSLPAFRLVKLAIKRR